MEQRRHAIIPLLLWAAMFMWPVLHPKWPPILSTRVLPNIGKTGRLYHSPMESDDADAYSIVVVGSDVYVAGVKNSTAYFVAKYWKNGQAIALSDGTWVCLGKFNMPLWAAMYMWQGCEWNGSAYVAKYWKNGQAVSLTDGTNEC